MPRRGMRGGRRGGRGGPGAGRRGGGYSADGRQWKCRQCMFKNHELMQVCEQCEARRGEAMLPVERRAEGGEATSLAGLASLLGSPLRDHVAAVRRVGGATYADEVLTLLSRGVYLSPANRGRVLAALWAAGEKEAFDRLLLGDSGFADSVVEVLRAVQLIDAPRLAGQLRRKIDTLTARAAASPGSVRRVTLLKLQSQLENATAELERPRGAGGAGGAPPAPPGSGWAVAAGPVPGAPGFKPKKNDESAGEASGPEGWCRLTTSCVRRVRAWVGRIPKERLEFIALTLPFKPWRELADLCHLHPTDFALPHFMYLAFAEVGKATVDKRPSPAAEARPEVDPAAAGGAGAAASAAPVEVVDALPDDSLVARARAASPEDLALLLHDFPRLATMYSFLRSRFEGTPLPTDAKVALAQRMPLEDALWFWEELRCPGVDTVLTERLSRGEEITSDRGRSNFGTLMERLVAFEAAGAPFAKLLLPYAERRLTEVKMPDSRLTAAVFGDASGSMEVAIRAAAILGGLLSACLNAELIFFRDTAERPDAPPRSAADVLRVARETRAESLTAPTAALNALLESRTPVDLLCVVTDEEENHFPHGQDFAQMFLRYREEVCRGTKLFFVSLLPPTITMGRMVAKLRRRGVDVRLYALDPRRPDLSKFSQLLGLVALEAATFGERAEPLESKEAEVEAPATSSAPKLPEPAVGVSVGGGGGAGEQVAEDARAVRAEVARLRAELAAAEAAAAAAEAAASGAVSPPPEQQDA